MVEMHSAGMFRPIVFGAFHCCQARYQVPAEAEVANNSVIARQVT